MDEGSPNTTLVSTNSGEDSDPSLVPRGKPRRGRPNKKKFTKKRTTPRPEPRSDTPPATEDASDTVASSRPVRAAVVNAAAISEAQAEILCSLDVKTGRRGASKMRGRGRYKHLNEGERP